MDINLGTVGAFMQQRQQIQQEEEGEFADSAHVVDMPTVNLRKISRRQVKYLRLDDSNYSRPSSRLINPCVSFIFKTLENPMSL